jgi:prefoldin beta subunit
MSEPNQEKLQEMQMAEQSLQQMLMQKQAFQMEFNETEAALEELTKAGDDVFKIIGQLMIKTDKKKTQEELENKKKLIDLRIKSFEKQEKTFTEKLESLREEVLSKEKAK